MKMVSYWKDENGNSPAPFYDDEEELFLIYGYYDHKNQSGGDKEKMQRCLGIHWNGNYPYVSDPNGHSLLAPFVIPSRTAKLFLKGLFLELLSIGEKDKAEKVSEAIRFLSCE